MSSAGEESTDDRQGCTVCSLDCILREGRVKMLIPFWVPYDWNMADPLSESNTTRTRNKSMCVIKGTLILYVKAGVFI